MSLKQTIKKIKESVDLSKAFRINKIVFRIGLGVILLLFALSVMTDGFQVIKGVKYLECPEDSEGCMNPFYDPLSVVCDEFTCDPELEPGEILGVKPGWLSRNLQSLIFLILFLTILSNWGINHKKGLVDYKKFKEMMRK